MAPPSSSSAVAFVPQDRIQEFCNQHYCEVVQFGSMRTDPSFTPSDNLLKAYEGCSILEGGEDCTGTFQAKEKKDAPVKGSVQQDPSTWKVTEVDDTLFRVKHRNAKGKEFLTLVDEGSLDSFCEKKTCVSATYGSSVVRADRKMSKIGEFLACKVKGESCQKNFAPHKRDPSQPLDDAMWLKKEDGFFQRARKDGTYKVTFR